MTRLKSAFTYFGGKGLLANKLLEYFPDHRTYIEPFGGSAQLLFAKPRSTVEVYNDIDSVVVDFFRLLQDTDAAERFCNRLHLTLFARKTYEECFQTWQEQADVEERVYRWFVVARQLFGGWKHKSSGWAHSAKKNHALAFMNTVDQLPEIIERLRHVQIEHESWEYVLDTYDTDYSFFYLDPPYIMDTRKGGRYQYEMTADDHQRLADRIQQLSGKVMLSSYPHAIYDALGWERVDIDTFCHAVGRTLKSGLKGKGAMRTEHKRTESIYINYEMTQLSLL